MRMIREEIGPDAVILDSNPVRSKGIGGLFKQGVEVVAAYDPSAARSNASATSKPATKPAAARQASSQSVAARYAAATRPEAAGQPETDDTHENVEITDADLEPVIFPMLNMRDAAIPAAESAAPMRAAEEPEYMPARKAPANPKPVSASKEETYRSFAMEQPYLATEQLRRETMEYPYWASVEQPRRTEEKQPASQMRREVAEQPYQATVEQPRRTEPKQAEQQPPAFVEYEVEPEPLRDEISSLKDTVQALAQRMSLIANDPALTLPPEILKLYNSLIDQDVPEDVARRVALMTQAAHSPAMKVETAARQIVMDRLGEPMPIRIRPNRQNVLFFVGPTGAGKTTTLVKLAGKLALEHKLRVGFVNMDTYRIGAIEHMRIYADIMELPLRTAYSAADLKEAIAQMSDRDVVLVDTAGKVAGDVNYRKEITEWISAARADEIFLVMSVATGHRAVREIVNDYSFLPDYKLILTKLDEVKAWGNVLHVRELAGKPLAYVTTGQNVPDDIRPADMRRLADNIIGKKVCAL